jgi:hypothetical protein
MPEFPTKPFSIRHGVRPPAAKRKPEDVPKSAKIALIKFIDEIRSKRSGIPGAYTLGPKLAEAARKEFESPGDMTKIRALINDLQWFEFYDVTEELVRMSDDRERMAREIDAIFASEGLPYRMTASGVDWRYSEAAVEEMEQAERSLATDPRFAGPLAQWQKARQHLSDRPPDSENCIKDAVGAVEGVARILHGSSDTLGQIIKPLGKSLGVHAALTGAISNLYGYLGDEQAVAHGATVAPSDLLPEAEFLLHSCAATIVFLLRKAGIT